MAAHAAVEAVGKMCLVTMHPNLTSIISVTLPWAEEFRHGVHHRTMSLEAASMISHEKFQKGRGWAYLAGIVVFAAVVAWRFLAR